MKSIITLVVPLFSDARQVDSRRGASEAVYCVVKTLKDDVLPFIVFFIVALLSRMSDSDEGVRYLCTHVFAEVYK